MYFLFLILLCDNDRLLCDNSRLSWDSDQIQSLILSGKDNLNGFRKDSYTTQKDRLNFGLANSRTDCETAHPLFSGALGSVWGILPRKKNLLIFLSELRSDNLYGIEYEILVGACIMKTNRCLLSHSSRLLSY